MRTTIAQKLEVAGEKAAYDAACKRILAEKHILAWILQQCLWEYRSCTVEEIATCYIEGEAQIDEIMVGVDEEKGAIPVLRLLGVLFSGELTAGQKQKILEEEFQIPMTENVEREVEQMCNLSEGIYDRGLQQGLSQGLQKGLSQGREEGFADGISQVISQGKPYGIKNMIKLLHLPLEQAMLVMGISEEEKEYYTNLILENAEPERIEV